MRYIIPLTAMQEMYVGQVKSIRVSLSRGTASLTWALMIIFTGSSLIGVTRGWTYHYSKVKMNWAEARQWCQTTYTDMVAIQSQEENDYLVSILPNKTGSPYYWIGITRAHANETWTWVGHNSSWIGNKSWAQNEPNNNHATEFCVEIYVNNQANRGRWNDEKCANKKDPVCYQAQCTNASCERGTCSETINNTICICEPGFEGDRCQTAVACKEPIKPHNGGMRCTGPHGNHSFESTCSFLCEEGFVLSGPSVVSCNYSGLWDDKEPQCAVSKCTNASCERGRCSETINKTSCICEPGFEGDRCQAAVACKEPIKPHHGSMRCSGPHGNHRVESTCSFLCEEGFVLSGPSVVSCNYSGLWDDKEPQCTVVECSALSGPDDGYIINCSGSNQTFNSTCRFGCSVGFLLLGSTEVTCGSDGRWRGPRPFCASYKHALMALASCVACSAVCCLCFCCSKYRKRKKKRTQPREPEEATIPANETYD